MRDARKRSVTAHAEELERVTSPQFRTKLKAIRRDFAPHLLVIDPWNAVARDTMEKDYQEAFAHLRKVRSVSPENPAFVIDRHLEPD